MSHKSIIKLFAVLFLFCLLDTILQFHSQPSVYPEILFSILFALLSVVCIIFFKSEDAFLEKNERYNYIEIFDQNMIIHKVSGHHKFRKNPLAPYNFKSSHNLKKKRR